MNDRKQPSYDELVALLEDRPDYRRLPVDESGIYERWWSRAELVIRRIPGRRG
jgi:hypothetical protein